MTGTQDRAGGPRLIEVVVADPPESWAAAGFAVEDDQVRLDTTVVRLTGPASDGARGIQGWTLSGLDAGDQADLDGLPTVFTEGATGAGAGDADLPVHPNGTTAIEHIVVLTPDLDRTIAALGSVGLDCRRIRETESHGSPMRQAFFRLGPVVLEVVSGDVGIGLPAADAPAGWFGLAVEVDDLDETAAVLGDGLGPVKPAVQDGQRIATLRHKQFGMSVAVAAMDGHGDRHADPHGDRDVEGTIDPQNDR